MTPPDVLLEDNHCLALNKPAGLLTQGDLTGAPSLITSSVAAAAASQPISRGSPITTMPSPSPAR